jgi:SNF2 family DNA or RNA helicase
MEEIHEFYNRSIYVNIMPHIQLHKDAMRAQKHAELRLLLQSGKLLENEIQNELTKFAHELENYTIDKFIADLQIVNNKLINIQTGDIIQNLYGKMFLPVNNDGIICGYRLHTKSINSRQLDIYLKVDFNKLYNVIKTGQLIEPRVILSEILANNNVTLEEQKLCERAQMLIEEPVQYQMGIRSPQIKNIKLKLFMYQYNNIKWMEKVEKSVNVPFKFLTPSLIRIPLQNDQSRIIYLDRERGRFFTENDNKSLLQQFFDKFYLRGGILADEMGRGKTACAIIHCLRRQEPKIVEPTINNCIYTTPDGYDKYIKTTATLVFVPNQCCMQWKEEILNITDNIKVNIIMITCKKDFENIKYIDIINADFVIVPYAFFKNSNCIKYYQLDDYVGSFFTRLDTYRFESLRNNDILTKTCPLFNMFYWKRVIIDEAHEVFQTEIMSNKQYRIIDFLKSEFRWGLTGTPFANGILGIQRMLRWLTLNEWIPTTPGVFANFLNKNSKRLIPRLIRRNTTKSTEHESKLPPILEQEVWINFTEVEKAMYDNKYATCGNPHSSTFLRQFCCYPQLNNVLSNCKSMDEIHQQLILNTKKEIEELESGNKENNNNLTMYTQFLRESTNRGAPIHVVRDYTRNIDMYKKRIEKTNEEIERLKRSLNFLSNVIPQIKSGTTGDCPICINPIIDIGITKCGHVFCYQCISGAIDSSNSKCPTCRIDIQHNGIYHVQKKIELNESGTSELKILIDSYGSKLANIITFLKKSFESKNDHVIIFSQWNKLLLKVGEVLMANKIEYVYCKGNRLSREKAIKLFNKSDTVRVILLSSEYASAGTNLTRANKIYLLEPVYGTKKFKEDIESQAIGRAHRLGQKRPLTIVRFLIKDTIEEQIHKGEIDLV